MVVVAVHGPSCSGKTTICRNLKGLIGAHVICQDDFYEYGEDKLKKITVKGSEEIDFDCRESIAEHKFEEKMKQLLEAHHEDNDILIVEGTMLAAFEWLHGLVDLWILLAANKGVCTERRRSRVYKYPESDVYYPHHAFPASENMKWEFVRDVDPEHAVYICHVHDTIDNNCYRVVDIINKHKKTPVEVNAGVTITLGAKTPDPPADDSKGDTAAKEAAES